MPNSKSSSLFASTQTGGTMLTAAGDKQGEIAPHQGKSVEQLGEKKAHHVQHWLDNVESTCKPAKEQPTSKPSSKGKKCMTQMIKHISAFPPLQKSIRLPAATAQINFVGRLIGPKGHTIAQIERDSDCILSVINGKSKTDAYVLIKANDGDRELAEHKIATACQLIDKALQTDNQVKSDVVSSQNKLSTDKEAKSKTLPPIDVSVSELATVDAGHNVMSEYVTRKVSRVPSNYMMGELNATSCPLDKESVDTSSHYLSRRTEPPTHTNAPPRTLHYNTAPPEHTNWNELMYRRQCRGIEYEQQSDYAHGGLQQLQWQPYHYNEQYYQRINKQTKHEQRQPQEVIISQPSNAQQMVYMIAMVPVTLQPNMSATLPSPIMQQQQFTQPTAVFNMPMAPSFVQPQVATYAAPAHG